MNYKHKFFFEIKRINNQTKLIILSPTHTRGPKIIAIGLIIGFSTFFGISLIEFIQAEQGARDRDWELFSLLVLGFGVCFCVFASIIFFAQFTVIFGQEAIIVGHRFWNIHRSKTIQKQQIITIHWNIKETSGENFIYLIIETFNQTYRFQPLGITITKPQPAPELQQFLDDFLQVIQHELSDLNIKWE